MNLSAVDCSVAATLHVFYDIILWIATQYNINNNITLRGKLTH